MNQPQALQVQAIRTPQFRAGDSLVEFIERHVDGRWVKENLVLAITTKILSLAENRLVARGSIAKADLVRQEADVFLGAIGYGSLLTIKHGLLIASAGIDESNSADGEYILYPADPFASLATMHSQLRARWQVRSLGLLLTDSVTRPLRYGVTGASVAHWGFRGLESRIGEPDLFGRPLQMTKVNVADALAAAAVFAMGECAESTPLAIITGAAVTFADQTDRSELMSGVTDDMYRPLYAHRIEASK